MKKIVFPAPDNNGIISLISCQLSAENLRRKKLFGRSAWLYDLAQEYWVRPRIHKAVPRRHREIFARMLEPFQEKEVLDVACGTGAAIAYLDKSHHYTGLDLSYPMLKRAVKKARKKDFTAVRFLHANAEEPFFVPEAFDLVVMDTALHMIPRYEKALTEIAGVLKNGGVFVCSVPVVGIDADFDACWNRLAVRSGLHKLEVPDLEAVCTANDLVFSRFATNGGVLYFRAQKN